MSPPTCRTELDEPLRPPRLAPSAASCPQTPAPEPNRHAQAGTSARNLPPAHTAGAGGQLPSSEKALGSSLGVLPPPPSHCPVTEDDLHIWGSPAPGMRRLHSLCAALPEGHLPEQPGETGMRPL